MTNTTAKTAGSSLINSYYAKTSGRNAQVCVLGFSNLKLTHFLFLTGGI
jgi:hypothetical protein